MNSRVLACVVASCLAVLPARAFNFTVSKLQGVTLAATTSLQFGPDHRLYVAQVNGQILALTVQRISPNNYQVVDTEVINLVRDIPNYNDDGTRNTALTTRQCTGILVVGTAADPVIYASSSDPRIGGGSGGENDLNLDTNSGIISRLTRSGSTWSKVDLVRGLPRSEENHATNGLVLDPAINRLYVAQGGNTNAGAPSVGFAFYGETALSAAVLAIDLNAIDALPVKTDAYGQKYLYNLPTLNDPNSARAHNSDGTDVNDPFGGNDGLNQARLVEDGPVQVYASGFRNPYDVVLTRTPGREGRLYTFDNGPNQGWGGYPKNEGTSGTVTNEYVEGEPGTVNNKDNLHLITGPGFYGGHPIPIRANPAGAGWFYFDNSKPAGSEMIFSPKPTADWPPVPVAMADPQQGDYRQPGVSDGALMTYSASTNGMAEYVATNFSGGMQGNLIAAAYDGTLLRIALNSSGTTVTNGVEPLASGFGTVPLDVTTPDPGHGAAFVGTIWVAHYSKSISVLEPADFDSPGGATCTGINSFDIDEDKDGFSNADEISNNSDPCSAAIRPPDVDGDFVSDQLDTDDDNDGKPDLQDPFPLDPVNGKGVALPVHYELFNETGIGFYGVGFTGVMMNQGQNYLQRITADNVIAGGTAGLFTLAQAGGGTARGSANNQNDAYQFAFSSDEFTTPFVITARLAGPFFAGAPTGNQTHGIYLGNGDQNNYVSIALNANNGAGGLEVVHEQGGTVIAQKMYPLSNLNDLTTVDLKLIVDPQAATVQPGYVNPTGTNVITLGTPIAVGGEILAAVMGQKPVAVGVFANTGGSAPTFSATWDFVSLQPTASTALAKFTIDPPVTTMSTSSTYTAGSFQIQNLSTGGQQIEDVSIDLSTAMFPDMVFDTTGTAGDPDFKGFEPNSASTGVTVASGVPTKPHNGTNAQDGYDGLDIAFNAFPPGGTFTFSIDVDPTNVKGVAAPGEGNSASVSGLELIGAAATIYFSDGSVHRTRLGRVEASLDGSYGWLRSDKPPKPGIAIVGAASPVTTAQPVTVRVTGPAGFNVSLVTVEAALYIGGVPNGGYDLDPYESNTAIKITEASGTISGAGYAEFLVTPTKTNASGGYNHITAVLSNDSGIKGPASDALMVRYDAASSGGDTQAPSTPQNLTSSNVTSSRLTLSWSASTDNVDVVGYQVLRNGTLLTTTTGLTYTDFGLDPGSANTYTVRAKDSAGNLSPAASKAVTTDATGTVVLRVNAGGPSFIDSSGKTWAADNGYNIGSTTSTTLAIDRTIDDPLFKTERYDPSAAAPDLTYSFALTNGEYEVQLFLAETHTASSGPGLRVMDVAIENSLAFDNLDIFAQAGGPATALVVSATTTVKDGQLNITFLRGSQNPKVNAIKVIKLPSAETTPPSTPGNLTASNVTTNSATLQWSASTDNVGVTGYVVSRNGSALQTVTQLSFADSGLAASTTYNYEVRATDAAGNVSAPATISVTTLGGSTSDTIPPSAPGSVTFSNVTSSSVTVKWTAATDNVGVTGYRISRAGTVLSTVSGLTFDDSGLNPSTSYAYSVVALDAAGNASNPATGSVTTSSSQGSTAVVRINAGGPAYVDSSGNTWAADSGYNTGTVSTNTATVTGTTAPILFRTERYDPAGGSELQYIFNVVNGSYLVRLHFAETYASTKGVGLRVFDVDIQSQRAFENVDIFAQAGGGNKALMLQAPATVTDGTIKIRFLHQTQNPKVNAIEIVANSSPDTQAPSAPTGLKTTSVTSSQVALSWTAASDNIGVTGYRVSRDGTSIGTVATTTFQDSAVAANKTYAYTVVALDAAGNVSPAASLNVTTPASADTQAPTAPTGLKTTSVTSTQVALSWTASTDNVGVTGYRVSRDGTSIGTVTTTTFQDSNAAAAKTYAYTVVALDAAGNVSPAASLSVTTPAAADTQAPTAPGNLAASAVTANSLTLNWSASTDNVGVTGYAISRNGTALTTTTGTTFSDTGLSAATTYTYQVVARDAAGNASSPTSVTVTTSAATTDQPPTAPTNLAASAITSTSLNLSWTASTDDLGVSGYRVYRDDTLVKTVTAPGFSDTGLTANTVYTYKVVAFDAAGNTTSSAALNVTTEAAFVLRVNSGGAKYTDSSGRIWAADNSYNTGKSYTVTSTVSGTSDPVLYRTERFDEATAPELVYTFAVPNGEYLVRLHFAETYTGAQAVGRRIFDVDVQGQRAFDNLDIFAQAGGGNKALVKETTVTVSNGSLTIGFLHQLQNPKVNAIEIRPVPTGN